MKFVALMIFTTMAVGVVFGEDICIMTNKSSTEHCNIEACEAQRAACVFELNSHTHDCKPNLIMFRLQVLGQIACKNCVCNKRWDLNQPPHRFSGSDLYQPPPRLIRVRSATLLDRNLRN
ncbi:hypothetical protein L208DRAFT_1417525 [Tricholoma matsutake]|nr:hypothetical protein L208DRAFT_1417525 [Tricholoma matsutake 945]